MTRKIVSEMTYNVSMGTLNPTIPIPHSAVHSSASYQDSDLSVVTVLFIVDIGFYLHHFVGWLDFCLLSVNQTTAAGSFQPILM